MPTSVFDVLLTLSALAFLIFVVRFCYRAYRAHEHKWEWHDGHWW